MERKAQKQKVSWLHSMKAQLLAVVLAVAVIIVTLYTILIMPKVKNNIREIYADYLLDLSISYGKELDNTIAGNDPNLLSNSEELKNMLQEIGIEGKESAYAYLVSFDGTMLYHPTPEKIGQPVENDAVMKMLSQIQSGTIPEPETVQYVFKGAKKFAACYTSQNQYILVVTADDSDLLAPATMLERRGIGISVFLLILGAVVALLFARRLTKPLLGITDTVEKIAHMDLRDDSILDKHAENKGEVGSIARSVLHMKKELCAMVNKIRQQSEQLYAASEVLNKNAAKTSGNVNNVELAVDEIATGATSQADETQKATDDIVAMGTMIEDASAYVNSLNETAGAISDSSQIAKSALQELNVINKKAIDSVGIIYEQTNTTNESAMKIKDATTLIASIADETNLLSLNASIEAARAGEAGKGFAVVASQIQKLAEQSNASTKQIDEIIQTLLADSQMAVHTMEEVREIMNQQSEKVAQTQEIFDKVSIGIEESINGMSAVARQTNQLDATRSSIVDTVQSLSAIAQENAASTEETSASMMEIGSVVHNINENAEELKNIAEVLEESIKKFKLDGM